MTMGRPQIEITPEMCKRAESLAAQGLTMEQIASVLGMSRCTVFDKQANYPDFSDAISAGRDKGIAQVTNALFKKATDGDITAQKYYLSNRDNKNWKDRRDVNVGGQDDNPVAITEVRRIIVDPKPLDEG